MFSASLYVSKMPGSSSVLRSTLKICMDVSVACRTRDWTPSGAIFWSHVRQRVRMVVLKLLMIVQPCSMSHTINEKLLSLRSMSTASHPTSLSSLPTATPTSPFLQHWCVVHSITSHTHALAHRMARIDGLELVLQSITARAVLFNRASFSESCNYQILYPYIFNE